MSFEYTQIEDDVVTRLGALLVEPTAPAGYIVKPMPETEKGFELSLSKCLILVAYSDSSFQTPSSVDMVTQNEVVAVLVNIKSPKLRGDFSIHQALRLCKMILIGYKPTNCGKMYLEKIEMDERDEQRNFFSYNMVFKTKKLQVEVEEETELPRLVRLTFEETYEAPNFS